MSAAPAPSFVAVACRPTRAQPRRAAIMVVTMLSLILLASFVFYIFNVGQHVAYRIETQNAADNAAISGAGWVARSFNTVAMNNVEMARLIPLVAVMDAVPVSVAYTLEDQLAVRDAVNSYLEDSSGLPPHVETALRNVVLPNIESQIESLIPLNELLNSGGYDIGAMTFYQDSSGQRGQMWQAIESLSALNVATLENLGLLSQFNAFRGAQIAQRDGGLEGGGLLLPWLPEVPWTQGSFEDFETVVASGQLPDNQDNEETARGPFDTLFGMRQRGEVEVTNTVELGTDARHTSEGGVPPPIERIVDRATVETYFTNGTFRLVVDQIDTLGQSTTGDVDGLQRVSRSDSFFPAPSPNVVIDDAAPLAPSQWTRRVNIASATKIRRVFPGVPGISGELIDPVWRQNYSSAVSRWENAPETIQRGMYISLEFRQEPDANGVLQDHELVMWGIRVLSGIESINPYPDFSSTRDELVQIEESAWELASPDPAERESDDEQFFYYDFWVGVNTGDVIEIRDPYNFDAAERGALPGPVNFTPDEFGPDEEFRRGNLTLMGIAHQPKDAAFMPDNFDDDRADAKLVGLAQAEVFNNHSWDLWTQMWHAQLMPIDSYDVWLDALEDPQGTDNMPWLDADDLTAVTEYLRAVEPLAPLMLEH